MNDIWKILILIDTSLIVLLVYGISVHSDAILDLLREAIKRREGKL